MGVYTGGAWDGYIIGLYIWGYGIGLYIVMWYIHINIQIEISAFPACFLF